nr:BFH_HP1_G0048520.mRNA.1.CDS.1 [Saccharomyces cerevisiae]
MALLKEQLFVELAILPENTRINKVGEKSFQIWVASENVKNQITETYPSGQITLSNAVTKVESILVIIHVKCVLVASYLKEAQKNSRLMILKKQCSRNTSTTLSLALLKHIKKHKNFGSKIYLRH